GRYLYFASDRSGIENLWRVRIDEDTGRVLGDATPVTTSSRSMTFASVSQDGRRIVGSSAEARAALERVPIDPERFEVAGPAVAIVQTSDEVHAVDVAPDGSRLVYRTAIPREVLFVIGSDGTAPRRLVDDEFRNRWPRWSPDGSRIAFYSNRSGNYEIWTIH